MRLKFGFATTARATIMLTRAAIGAVALAASVHGPAWASDPATLALSTPKASPVLACTTIAAKDLTAPRTVTLSKVLEDDFTTSPLLNNRWQSHYLGGSNWPEALYWGGVGSDGKRTLSTNGEQEIYVDPKYSGLGKTPLGLNPFSVGSGGLTITAQKTPTNLLPTLMNYPYESGVLTSYGTYSAQTGYFEITSQIPAGDAVWPAFWLAAADAWPPEIDIFEGRGQLPGVLAMSIHWRDAKGALQGCGLNFTVANATTTFHTYGALWETDRVTYFIDRKAVSQIQTPPGFTRPMFMIVNLAIGSKVMTGVGKVVPTTPATVKLNVQKVTVYKISSVK